MVEPSNGLAAGYCKSGYDWFSGCYLFLLVSGFYLFSGFYWFSGFYMFSLVFWFLLVFRILLVFWVLLDCQEEDS